LADKEIRQLENLTLEVRAGGTGGQSKTIGGYAIKYNSPTLIVDRWGDQFLEEFSPGAFESSLESRSQKALWNHDISKPLGSVKSGTLRFNPDLSGLNYDVDTPNNTWGNDAYESVQRGDVDGSSFGFRCIKDVWSEVEYEGQEIYKRSIIQADLLEVSPCTFPAYESSEISVRSFEGLKKEKNIGKARKEELRKKLILKTYL
jgi:HK97 family phage prohead protease